MPPDLVIATAPSVEYPGGVIAVRAADWIAPGSSTASSEANALASTGQVVRETQQVASTDPPFLGYEEYDLASDTLVIPCADIGLEDEFSYDIWVTCFLEGERDLTNNDLLNRCSNYVWNDVALAGVHGTFFETEDGAFYENRTLANVPHFWPLQLEVNFIEADDDILHFRFLTQDGTTAEWLIDQLIFVPSGGSASWTSDDFEYVFSDVGIPAGADGPDDGPDGGDANGKFTFSVGFSNDSMPPNLDYSDYQQKADGDDAEYDQVVTEADHEEVLFNSQTDAEANAYGYSFHCVRLRDEIMFTEDTFDNRTTGPSGDPHYDMGISPEGYGYQVIHTSAAGEAYVDGSKAVLSLRNGLGSLGLRLVGTVALGGGPGSAEFNQGSRMWGHGQWSWRAILEWVSADAGLDIGFLRIWIMENGSGNHLIYLDLVTQTWEYFSPMSTSVDGPNDASGFLVAGQPFGFRFEAKHYLFRFRFWDAAGAEPGTWDYEDEWIVDGTAYPYSDDEVTARGVTRPMSIEFDIHGDSSGSGPFAPTVFYVHNSQFEHDPYGDPEDGHVRVERPHGTSLGDITIPWGCPYMVYWGEHDWTEPGGAFPFNPQLEFSSRWWNDTAAAELQRLVTYFHWFRAKHVGKLIPINWRQSDRQANLVRLPR